MAQDLPNIINISRKLVKYTEIHILIVGEGSEYNNVKKIIDNESLKNISIHKSVHHNDYQSMLSEFEIGIISLDKDFKTENYPGKMLGYMLNSMPIIASVNKSNDLINLINDNKMGFASVNGENELIIKNILKIYRDKSLLYEYGKNSFNILNKYFNVKNTANQILSKF